MPLLPALDKKHDSDIEETKKIVVIHTLAPQKSSFSLYLSTFCHLTLLKETISIVTISTQNKSSLRLPSFELSYYSQNKAPQTAVKCNRALEWMGWSKAREGKKWHVNRPPTCRCSYKLYLFLIIAYCFTVMFETVNVVYNVIRKDKRSWLSLSVSKVPLQGHWGQVFVGNYIPLMLG